MTNCLWTLTLMNLRILKPSWMPFRKQPEDPFSVVISGPGSSSANNRQAVRGQSIIELNGLKIAYLSYGSFDVSQERQLIQALNQLAQAMPDEMILDLRGNPGGIGSLAKHIGIAVMGRQAVEGQELFHHEANSTLNAENFCNAVERVTS